MLGGDLPYKNAFLLSLKFNKRLKGLGHNGIIFLRHKSSSKRKQLGVHKRVPVIFRGSMLDKNPGTCRTSPGQGMGQRFSMCTHTKYMTKSASHYKFRKPCYSIIRYAHIEKASLCLPGLQVFLDHLGATEQASNTTFTYNQFAYLHTQQTGWIFLFLDTQQIKVLSF